MKAIDLTVRLSVEPSHMPIYLLTDEIAFPPPAHADPSGLLAVGGDLKMERLLLAYKMGIFPWYGEGQPILWWSPDPRTIFEPEGLHISRRLQRRLKSGKFDVTFDRAFADVIHACATVPRKQERGTWLTSQMIQAYLLLHQEGYAHSVEIWMQDKLAGGVYGVSLGRCFFGESMFYSVTDASKVALVALANQLKLWHFDLIDAQVYNPHLLRLGAREIPRPLFLDRLTKAVSFPTFRGNWGELSGR